MECGARSLLLTLYLCIFALFNLGLERLELDFLLLGNYEVGHVLDFPFDIFDSLVYFTNLQKGFLCLDVVFSHCFVCLEDIQFDLLEFILVYILFVFALQFGVYFIPQLIN